MISDAYVLQHRGRSYVLKATSPGNEPRIRQMDRVHRWVRHRGRIAVPELIATDPDGLWSLAERVEGPTVMELLQQGNSLSPELLAGLREIFDEAQHLADVPGIVLDLRSDNIRVRDGLPVLVDLGPLGTRRQLPTDFDSMMNAWQRGASDQVNAVGSACTKIGEVVGRLRMW